MSGFGEITIGSDHPGLVHLVLGRHGELEWSNTAALQLGATARESPTVLADLIHPDDREIIRIMLAAARRDQRAEGTVRVQDTLTGSLRHFHLILTTAGDPATQEVEVSGYVAQAWDVTALVQRQHELEAHAYRDELTGLVNRRTFVTRLETELDISRRRCLPVAVLFADVDHFKTVNDTHGHQIGDQVLIELAARLASRLRPDDTLARIGGDEFAVICPNLSGWPAACSMVDRLRIAAAVPITAGRRKVRVTLSVGVAFAEESNSRPDAAGHLVALADTRMFRAKFAQRSAPNGDLQQPNTSGFAV